MKISSLDASGQKNLSALSIFFGAFAFYAFIMWCAPYSSDDLEFGHLAFPSIAGYLDFALYYGNGRFLGNLFSMLLSGSKFLCVLIKSFMVASAVVLAPTIMGLRNKSSYLLTFLLLTSMTPTVFGETIAWTSGFSNYFPPVWLCMLIVLMIQQYNFVNKPLRLLFWLAVPVLGLASQLFVEHSSGVNGLLAFSFFVYYFRKKDKSRAMLSLLWLLSATVGLGLMLLIPKLFYRAGNRVDIYRSTHLGSLSSLIIGCAKNAIHQLNYYFGPCEIPLCFGAIVTVLKTRHARSEKANRILLGTVILASLYLAFSMLISVNGYYGKSAFVQSVLSAVSVLLPLGVWMFAALKLEPDLRRNQLFMLSLAIISILPLLVVMPSPPRAILQSYVFVILATLQCFDWTNLGRMKHSQNVLLASCVALSILLGSVFFSIHNMAAARDTHIRQEIARGTTEIEIFVLPYEYTSSWDYLWSFLYIYTDGKDITFDDVGFHPWMNSHY